MREKGSIFVRVLDVKQNGSAELRNEFLRNLKNDILRLTAIYCRKAGREPTDEEFLIALEAVDEAIDRYNEKEASFDTYASTVISSRLIDFFRREKRRKKKFVAHNHENLKIILDRKASMEHKNRELFEDLQDELARLHRILSNLGYTWADIKQNKPTHNDSLEKLHEIALHISKLNIGERYLKENPMSRELSRELRKITGVDRRTLKKYRPYLCTLVIVYTFDFPIIKGYLRKAELRYEGSQRDCR